MKINQNVLENEIKQLEVTQQGLVTKAQELGLVNNITTVKVYIHYIINGQGSQCSLGHPSKTI